MKKAYLNGAENDSAKSREKKTLLSLNNVINEMAAYCKYEEAYGVMTANLGCVQISRNGRKKMKLIGNIM
jgi:hypothetical protein